MLKIFDQQGIVHKEFVKKGCTVNAEYNKEVINRLIKSASDLSFSHRVTFFFCMKIHHLIPQLLCDSFWLKKISQR